jgi:HPt (histidine-containing phosphotransfer) domain-containing protein
MSGNTTPSAASSAEIDGISHPFVDQERLAILTDALGEAKVMELFLTARQSILESAEELRTGWQTHDNNAVGKSAHRLLGVAANFGCPALAAIAGIIEKSGKNDDAGTRYQRQFEEILTASLTSISF